MTIDLYDWDTAFALRLADFNRLIGTVVDTQDRQHELLPSGRSSARLNWRFGAWRIVEAVGSRIALELALHESSQIEIDGKLYDISSFEVSVATEMVLKPPDDSNGAKMPHSLVAAAVAGQRWAEVSVESDDVSYGFEVDSKLQELIEDWFTTADAVAAFNIRFAGLTIDTLAAEDGLAWIAPHSIGFAGATMPDGDIAIGLLARTGQRNNLLGAKYELSPYSIPDKADGAFVISAERFLEHFLQPALPHVFGLGNADSEEAKKQFPILDNVIRNSQQLQFPLQTDDGKRYGATIAPQQLEISIEGDELILHIRDMSFEIALGEMPLITIYITMTERLHAVLLSPANDPTRKVLHLSQVGEPQIERRDEESLYYLGGQLLVDVVLAIVTVLISKFGPKVLGARGLSLLASKIWTVVLALIAQALAAGLTKIPELVAYIEEKSLDGMPDFGAVLDASLANIHWQGSAHYELLDARFVDCLQLGVKFKTN